MLPVGQQLPLVYLARHGETEWSLTGQHTGLSDIALTRNGEQQALKLGKRLAGLEFAKVYSSPLQRAKHTCELAGFGAQVELLDNLSEWHYGAYEGITTKDILKDRPDFKPFRDGFPEGEAVEEIGARAELVVELIKSIQSKNQTSNILIFSHGHMLRFLAAKFLYLASSDARIFNLATASVSILGYDHGLTDPVIKLWNDASHCQ
ncbi:histidine phosphatase family protein [soil metagenome]